MIRVFALCLTALSGLAAPTLPALASDETLAQVVAGDWRKAEDRVRDPDRHPVESLDFWGLTPGMAILEVQPGGGWWTDILAPYAARTGGSYAATGPDLGDPELSERAKQGRARLEQKLANAELYGRTSVVNWGPKASPPPEGTFDFALVSRSLHGWMRTEGAVDHYLGMIFTGLKPGGILAIEQHRANPGAAEKSFQDGYVEEAAVIAAVEKAGFRLAGRSEVNANPKDTKDHPFGVWTLPPTRISVPYGSGRDPDPDFDHAPYDAIGESDRMTLKFLKPAD
ncbi:MAG: class I SAM-dependent methyltransferase [Steroidobacteraceae bacterium]